jgi:geranylgeranylglycerol-phosphate geranylgeranyltransferase
LIIEGDVIGTILMLLVDGLLYWIGVFSLVLLVIMNSFKGAFDIFHMVFFKSGTWIFDPNTEIIVRLFPEKFFFDLAMTTATFILLELAVFLLVGIVLLKDKKVFFKKVLFFRPIHSLFGMLGIFLGAFTVLGGFVILQDTVIAALALGFFISSIFIYNDIKDIEVDKINKPKRALPDGTITMMKARIIFIFMLILSILLSTQVNYEFFFLMLGCGVLSIGYSMRKKDWFSNVITAFLFSMLIILGGISVGGLNGLAIFFSGHIFIYILARELVKDIEDIKGDKKHKARTIPLKYGEKTAWRLIRIYSIAAIILSFFMINGTLMFILISVANTLFVYSAITKKNAKNQIYIALLLSYLAAITLWI